MDKKEERRLFFRDILLAFVAIMSGMCLARFVVFRVTVDGSSMEPTYYHGDSCFALVHKEPTRGDVVIIELIKGTYYIKRVIGMPGDIVSILDNKVYVNKAELLEPYLVEGLEYNAGVASNEIKLGINEYFVLGDNRVVSNDSRYFGAVSRSAIKGVVIGGN